MKLFLLIATLIGTIWLSLFLEDYVTGKYLIALGVSDGILIIIICIMVMRIR